LPENIIAKKLNIKLDTIIQKVIRTDFTAIIGDSVEINVKVSENGSPKNIENCLVRLIGIRSDKSYLEQTEKIEITDGTNGELKIYPKLDVLSVEGQCILGLVVEDEDESINIQRFSINVASSMAKDIIIDHSDDIETLVKLNKLLDDYRSDLTDIHNNVTQLENFVAQKITETNENFNEMSDAIENQIDDIQDRINGVNDTIKNKIPKSIELKPYRLAGSNYIYMESEVFNIQANELLKKAYDVFLGGIVESGNYNTALAKLTFYKTNNKISPFLLVLSDRSINSKTLSPSVVFGDLSSEISPTATGFKLMVKSNALKTLNLDSDMVCIFTQLGK